jgi:hypothetical protein
MGGRHTRVPVPLQASIIPPLRSYHKPPYVKNLSFCVGLWPPRTIIWLLLSRAPSEIPLPRAARLFYWYRAGPMLQSVSYVENSVMYIRNLIPDSMSITSSASPGLSGRGYALFTQPHGSIILRRVA